MSSENHPNAAMHSAPSDKIYLDVTFANRTVLNDKPEARGQIRYDRCIVIIESKAVPTLTRFMADNFHIRICSNWDLSKITAAQICTRLNAIVGAAKCDSLSFLHGKFVVTQLSPIGLFSLTSIVGVAPSMAAIITIASPLQGMRAPSRCSVHRLESRCTGISNHFDDTQHASSSSKALSKIYALKGSGSSTSETTEEDVLHSMNCARK